MALPICTLEALASNPHLQKTLPEPLKGTHLGRTCSCGNMFVNGHHLGEGLLQPISGFGGSEYCLERIDRAVSHEQKRVWLPQDQYILVVVMVVRLRGNCSSTSGFTELMLRYLIVH